MESVGAICEGEWNSTFNGMCSEEADFMAQLLGNPGAAVSCFWQENESNVKDLGLGGGEESSMYSSQETTNTSNSMFSFSLGHTNIFPSFETNNSLMTMDYCVMEGDDDFLNHDASNESHEKLQELFKEEDKIKKRPRIPAASESQRSKRFKKCAKVDENDDSNNTTTTTTTTTTNVVLHRQSSSGCYSEDDSTNNASHEALGMNSSSSSRRSGAQNSNGKARASRGSATDPQSLYARKRRERINERLKVLQRLVPNGTKVDISTMLEEAVQYVNFLQLQIKLLSSDDLWMYSPIAYNGMDLGLDLKIPSLKPQSS